MFSKLEIIQCILAVFTLLFLLFIGIFSTYKNSVEESLREETCSEYCLPYAVYTCNIIKSEFWHPKTIDVAVSCKGPDTKFKVIKR